MARGEQRPSVTVAVCTRDRPEDLRRCLEALEGLRYRELELLVIDNAPATDATERLVQSRHPRVRYIQEPMPGLDRARNRAIAVARGDILAFTDDDVVVDPGWVEAIARVFTEDPTVAAVTGLVLPEELETEAQRLFEQFRSFARGSVRFRVQAAASERSIAGRFGMTGSYGTGANMAFRRRLFDVIGPFDPCLGAGTPTRGGDDLEMFFRVLKAGYALVYEPRAIVRHRHRRTGAELTRQITDHGISFSSYLVRSSTAHPEERRAFGWLWAWWFAKTLYRVVRPRGTPATALRRLALAELKGLVIGLGRYRQARSADPTPARELEPA